MAFGFGFNKQKALSAAEKFVQQGKLQNAIAEYEKVLKNDDKDLTVANTIGDLYSRLGDSGRAIECFKKVGDAYAAQGFTVKGIAMYKKITKLQPSVDGSLKLAELYTQQGLFNDARAQYLQVAEDFMKNGELDQAVRLFRKVLEMDPENVPMRIKLAEVYIKLGNKTEAWEIFSAAAEALQARGALSAAEEVLQRMLVLDPSNSYVVLMRGRAALEGGDPKSAIQYLEKASDIDSHPDGLRDLLKAYLASGDLTKTVALAEKLLTVHNDPEGLFLLAEGATRLGQYDRALEIYTRHADRLLATDSTKLLANLHAMITHLRDDPAGLENVMELLKKSGESTHLNEVAELLAHASVKDGNLERGRDLYQMLATSEPQNAMHMQNYQQVVGRMSGDSAPAAARGITAEEGALIVEELEATAPVLDQSYPDQVAIAVRSAVTDADLFLSYNLPDKAIVPLLGVLPQAPRDVRLNQRLAALHTRFQRFNEAAVCCRTLESSYHDAGFPDEALRYGELAARYESSIAAGTPAPVRVLDVAPAAPAPAVPQHRVQEFAVPQAVPEMEVQAPPVSDDLSTEWEQTLTVEDGTAGEDAPAVVEESSEANPEIAETVEEIRFYLEHSMAEQAASAFAKLEALTRDAAILDPLRAALAAGAQPSEEPQVEIAEDEVPAVTAVEPETFEMELEVPTAPAPTQEIAASSELMSYHQGSGDEAAAEPEPSYQEPALQAGSDELTALVADLEASIGDSFPVASAAAEPVEAEIASQSHSAGAVAGWPAPTPARAPEPVRQVEHEVVAKAPAPAAPETMPVVTANSGGAAAAPAISYSPAVVRPLGAEAQASQPADSVDLSEMFSDLKNELEEEIVASDEDPETHYNMGVAFREMGLLDEAIAELQKVCTSVDRGRPFGQIMQTYTWLGQCFLDKGVPAAAVGWYEKALTIPGLSTEARVAINYELGAACEQAQDKPAALRHFTDAYGANIDYRDVAERIQALKS